MKLERKVSIILLTVGLGAFGCNGNAQTVDDELQAARTTLKADRKATVAAALQLTEQEGKAFWPLYDKYRAETDQLGDALLKLIKDYAQLYPDVPDDRATVMLKELGDLEKQLVETRTSYLQKIEKVVSPAKTLRFAQVETRLDLLLRVGLASKIPLVPVEGELTGQVTGATAVTEGVPGGSVVRTYQLEATVASVDRAARKVTLVDASGIKTTVKVGPEAVNFDQIHPGDKLKITVAQELVVSVAGEGEASSDGGAKMVALAPKGAKPGAVMAETTLQFEDGTTHTVAVRPDVDLSKRKVGDKVVIRTTGALAIQVVKP
jgi:hypothetical protein